MNTENRRAAAARIRALLAKTVDNGCTEEEAMAAAAKAGELMDKYGIESSEVEIRAEKCTTGQHRSRAGKKGQKERTSGTSEVSSVTPAIARFCSCKVWRTGTDLKFFGLPHDVEVAVYMTDAIETSMRSSFRRWRKGPERPGHIGGHALRASFMAAMANRLVSRLNEMTAARDGQAHKTSDGTSLVLVKSQVVAAQYAELGLKLKQGKSKTVTHYNDAIRAGQAAGDRHQFMDGVGSNRGALRIGAR